MADVKDIFDVKAEEGGFKGESSETRPKRHITDGRQEQLKESRDHMGDLWDEIQGTMERRRINRKELGL